MEYTAVSTVVNQSLEFTAEKAISQRQSCCKECSRRVWKLLRGLLAAIMCLGMPIIIVVALLIGGSGAPAALREVRTVKVGRDGIETGGGETQPANFTCAGNISGMISAEPAGNTLDEGLIVDHNRETIWRSSTKPIPTSDEQRHGRQLRPQQLTIALNGPVSCVEYVDVYWYGRFSAAAYNISAFSVFGDVVHLHFKSTDDSHDRVDSIRLDMSGLQTLQLNLQAPLRTESADDYSYRIRELELLGFRDAPDAGDRTQSRSCASRWQSENITAAIINITSANRSHIQDAHSLVDRDKLIVLENCTSHGGPKYTWERVFGTAAEVGIPWLGTTIVLWLLYAFRHSLRACCRNIKDRVLEQHSLQRATSRASYAGRFKAIKSRTDRAVLSLISEGLSMSLPIVTSPVASAVSPIPSDAVLAVTSPRTETVANSVGRTRNVVYGRGTAIVNFDCLDDFLKLRVMAWVDCTELSHLCRVCKWWRRLYPQAGHWVQVPFASPYWSGDEGRSRLACFPNLCCIEFTPDRGKFDKSRGATKGATYKSSSSSSSGRHHNHRVNDLLRRNDDAAECSGTQSLSLSASDLELRRTLISFRLRSDECEDSLSDSNRKGTGCATRSSTYGGDFGTGVPPAAWELSDDFVQQLFSRDCKLIALDLSNSSFNCRLKELKSVRELSLRKCHQLDVFTCDPSALPALQQLDLSSCSCLWDVNGLLNCWTVTEVDLSYCPRLENITPLAACSKLQTLNLSHCERLREVSVLAALSSLQHIDMSCTAYVDDIKPLASCVGLLSCDVSWTSVTDLMPLKDCNKLQLVDAQGCEGLLAEGVSELQRAGVRMTLRPSA